MGNKDLKIMLLKSRIATLNGKGPHNNAIVKKLIRELRNLEKI